VANNDFHDDILKWQNIALDNVADE